MYKTRNRLVSILLAALMLLALMPGLTPAARAAATSVSSWDELFAEYGDYETNVITIPSGTTVTVTDMLKVPRDGKTYTLTGGGTLRRGNASFVDMFIVQNDAKLTLENLTLDGGNITGDLDLVYVEGGEFTMTGGKIMNSAGEYGGVYTGGAFTMTGGSITGNAYGGVNVYGGTFSVSGGSITGNTDGGVNVYDGTFSVSGGATVTGNTSDGAACNVCLYDGETITVTGELSGKIGITADSPVSPTTVAVGDDYTITEDDLKCLSSDGGHSIYLDEDIVWLDNLPSINYADVTLEGVDDLVYNGQTQLPSAVIVEYWNHETEEYDLLTQGVDYTWEMTGKDGKDVYGNLYSAGKTAGWVEITITGKGAYTGKYQTEYYIGQKELTITDVTVADSVYDPIGTAAEVTDVTFEGLVGSEKLALNVDYMAHVNELVNGLIVVGENEVYIGIYSISAKMWNYEVINDYYHLENSFIATWNVTPATLTGTVFIGMSNDDGDGIIGVDDELYAAVDTNDDSSAVLTYQWLRDGEPIGGADSDTYTLTSDDADKSITVTITAEAPGNYVGSLTSAAVEVGKKPLGGSLGIINDVVDPMEWTTGTVLSLDTDDLDPDATYTIQWLRDGAPISGATGDTYTLTKDDLGKTIAVLVTGTGGYTGSLSGSVDIFPTAPDAPVLRATPGDGKVTLSWSKPFDGGSPIMAYYLGVFEGDYDPYNTSNLYDQYPLLPWMTDFTVEGLTNGTRYSFVLELWNRFYAAESLPVSATPTAGGSYDPGPSTPTTTTVQVEINGQKVNATVSADGTLTLTYTEADIKKYADESGTFDIEIAGQEKITLSIPTAALGGDNDLVVVTDFGTITIPSETLAALREKYGDPLILSITKGSFKIALLGADGKELEWSDPENPMIITLPYTLAAGEDGGAVVAVKKNGGDTILPFAVYKDGGVALSITATGTYDLKYNPKSYDDMGGHWAKDNIAFVSARELFSGTGDGEFSPDTSMTRAMFATVLARLDGADLSGYTASRFSDVPTGQWYTAAVEWAADNGIVNGVGDGKFDPNAPITREQMTVMLYHYIQSEGGGFKDAWMFLLEYADRDDIAEWAYEAVCYCTVDEIVGGKPGNLFDPQGLATRAEVATIFARFVAGEAK